MTMMLMIMMIMMETCLFHVLALRNNVLTSTSFQHRHKRLPRSSKIAPRGSQDRPRSHKMTPRSPQHGPNTGQEVPRGREKHPRSSLESDQDVPRGHKERPRGPLEATPRYPRGLKAPRGCQTVQDRPKRRKIARDGPKMPQDALTWLAQTQAKRPQEATRSTRRIRNGRPARASAMGQ